MAVIAVDPTLYADNIMGMLEDPRYEHITITGLDDVDKVSVYAIIIETLEGTGIRYGYMASDNCVIMGSEDVSDYLEELTENIIELTGVCVDEIEDVDDEVYGYENMFHDIDDESDAFAKVNGTKDDKPVNVHLLLVDYLQAALEDSIRVITGGYREIEANAILL